MESAEFPPGAEVQPPKYNVILPIGFVPRAARIANSIISSEIKSGERPETIESGEEEDAMGRLQRELNIGVFENRSVTFPLGDGDFEYVVSACNKLAEGETDPLKAGEIRDVVRRLTEQYEEAKNQLTQEAKEPSGMGSIIRSWFTKRTGHGKFE